MVRGVLAAAAPMLALALILLCAAGIAVAHAAAPRPALRDLSLAVDAGRLRNAELGRHCLRRRAVPVVALVEASAARRAAVAL